MNAGTSETRRTKCSPGIRKTLKALSQQRYRKNAIMIEELLGFGIVRDGGQEGVDYLREVVTEHYRVRIVVVYRRFFEWFLSLHNQLNKIYRDRAWPDEKGGTAIPTFIQYFRDSSFRSHPAADIHRAWLNRPGIESTLVYNLHHTREDLGAAFGKFAIPEEIEFWDRQEWEKLPSVKNPSVDFTFDWLAVEARKQGLIRKSSTLKRKEVAGAIQRQFPYKKWPMSCPDEAELQSLLDTSMSFEKEFEGLPLFPGDHDEHKEKFDEFVTAQEFCSVDAEQAMRDDTSLRKFLTSL